MRQDEVHDAPLRDHDLVRRAVEQVLAHPVAAGNAVDAGRNMNLRQAAFVCLGLVDSAGRHFLDADDGAFMDGVGVTCGIDGVHRQPLQPFRPGTLVVLDVTGHGKKKGESYENQSFHSLIRQVSP